MMRYATRYALLLVVTVMAVASCLSERTESVTGPVADCSLPLDQSVVGTQTTIVQIVNFAYVPEVVTISPGSSVTWP